MKLRIRKIKEKMEPREWTKTWDIVVNGKLPGTCAEASWSDSESNPWAASVKDLHYAWLLYRILEQPWLFPWLMIISTTQRTL